MRFKSIFGMKKYQISGFSLEFSNDFDVLISKIKKIYILIYFQTKNKLITNS
jgi:hypothetical protein